MKRFSTFLPVVWTAVLITFASVASAAEWGSLKGRFVVEGTPPARSPLAVGDVAFCIGQKPMDETVVVGEKGGLANVAVYFSLPRGQSIDIHPDYAELLKKPVELDNKNCHFVPHVTLLRVGQELLIKNSDPLGHNTRMENPANSFNEMLGAGDQRPVTLKQASTLPIPISCSIHTFMKGHVLLLDHPYMAVTDENGAFEIKNVPAGARGFTFWHEAPGYLRDLRVGSARTDRRGRAELTIKAGETLDLGEIRVPVASLR
jgi:hypothetical protein